MLEEGVFYNQRVLLGKLLGFALLHLYSTAKLAHYSRYLLTSYFCIPVPYDEKDIFFGVISKRSFSVIEPLNFTFSGISGWSIDLDYCNLEWSADEQEIILSFFRMHPSTPFWNIFFFLLWGLLHFFWEILARNNRYAAAKSLQSCATLPPHRRQPTRLPSSLAYSRQEYWSGLPFPSPVHESEKWKWWSSELNLPILVHFSSLIPKMLMFTLAICLTTSNLPWFMDLTFQVPLQCCSSQHWTASITCHIRGAASGNESCHFRRCKKPVLTHGLQRSPGVGNGNLLQYSFLENSVDGGAWHSILHRTAKS